MSESINTSRRCFDWQNAQWDKLQWQVANERLPHAALLAGPGGTGKHQFAEAFVAGWLCQSSNQGHACGQCQSCRLLSAGTHPDLCFPRPSGKSLQLKVDDIRSLVTFCSKTAQLGERRLVWLTPASSMNLSAQNALLKTLEEPGRNTLLLLVADRPQLLLPTVRSRCQQLWFPEVALAQAMQWLLEQGVESAAAEAALAATRTPLKALELSRAAWFDRRHDVARALLSLAQGNIAITAVEKQLSAMPQQTLIEVLSHWCHQTLRSGFLNQQPTDEALNTMLNLARYIGSRSLLRWYDGLQLAQQRLMRSANLNKELQLDSLLWLLTPSGRTSSL